MTSDEFSKFIQNIEAKFEPTINELKKAVEQAGEAHASHIRFQLAKPQQRGSIQAQHDAQYVESTREAFDRCVKALAKAVEGGASGRNDPM